MIEVQGTSAMIGVPGTSVMIEVPGTSVMTEVLGTFVMTEVLGMNVAHLEMIGVEQIEIGGQKVIAGDQDLGMDLEMDHVKDLEMDLEIAGETDVMCPETIVGQQEMSVHPLEMTG